MVDGVSETGCGFPVHVVGVGRGQFQLNSQRSNGPIPRAARHTQALAPLLSLATCEQFYGIVSPFIRISKKQFLACFSFTSQILYENIF